MSCGKKNPSAWLCRRKSRLKSSKQTQWSKARPPRPATSLPCSTMAFASWFRRISKAARASSLMCMSKPTSAKRANHYVDVFRPYPRDGARRSQSGWAFAPRFWRS
ncbi:hypothetical protein EH31_00925 [Erythrobacter longus]|uniref:Uncharacterized protein n=1 Tax=Erythrobacter longus TaxID=1044 RepID=A0A074N036_ERYLO|nr:hypothetical protein EH31_00925 [Erythrobacter longus]